MRRLNGRRNWAAARALVSSTSGGRRRQRRQSNSFSSPHGSLTITPKQAAEFLKSIILQSATNGDAAIVFTFMNSKRNGITREKGLYGVSHWKISRQLLLL